MEKGRWGISHKFIALVSAAVAAFMLSAFLLTRTMLERYALEASDEAAELILDQTDKRLVAFFSELEALARSLASTAVVRSADRAGMRDLFVSSVLARRGYLRAIYLGGSDGRMHEWGVGAEFVDYEPSFPPGYDPRLRPWYLSALERDGFSISAPYRYASVDDIGITCVLPVTGRDGSPVGVLGLDILLSSLAAVLDGLQIPKDGKAIVLGSNGEIIASQFHGDRPEGMILKRFAAGDALGSDAGSFVGSVDGMDTQYVYRRVDRLGWIVMVAMPLEPIRESVKALLNLIGVTELALMVALVVALAGISSRLIVSPLGHIVSVINRVEAGQRGLRAQVASSDEFGLLATEFNRLLDAVEENSSSLEGKVRLRTAELGRLQRENTRLKVIEERRRIYRDLHDTIGAKLTNIFFCNGVALDLAKDGPERLKAMLEGVESNCLQAVDSLKRVILGMGEDDANAGSFSLFVSAGVRQRLAARGMAFDCVIKDKRAIDALPAGLRDELERILDELVSNALKHSEAGSVRLRLHLRAGALHLAFSDDGVGFDPRARSSGSGLGNIRYRVKGLGGTLSVDTAEGQGSGYRIVVPVDGLPEVRS